jgi:hypothetical protein
MIRWCFPPNNFGVAAGVNDGAMDAFAGARLSSVVREIIQNSLDAADSPDTPVRISFSLDTVDKDEFDGFEGIAPHLIASSKMAKAQGLDDVVNFYDHSVQEVVRTRNVKVLSIHDFNTKGLVGPVDEPRGPWSALVKGAGISQKASSGSLGSFGHGSKAPFAYSQTRSLFYFSRINESGKTQDRFQGKSILQTHVDPNDPTQHTQGTGFYGHVEKLMPLIDDEVPLWAKRLRERVTAGTGTSIFVPYTDYRRDLYPETRITVIANFFYAIRSGALEVTVGEDLIDKTNLVEWFHDCERILDDEQDEIDVDYIQDCFKSINTILFPDHFNVQQIPGFGRIEWYMRVNDELEKKVGLARSSGMLITRKPPDLWVFRNVKPFDMFVCVNGQEGSEFLKRLENPTHDNFEFDRIKLADEKKKARRKYKTFQSRIRDIINENAKMDDGDEEDAPDLGFLFSDVSDTETSDNKMERGNTLLIRDGAFKRVSSSSNTNPNKRNGAFGDGTQGGDGSKKTKGGNIPSPTGSTPIQGQSPDGENANGARITVNNFRANHSSTKKNSAKLYFDSPLDGTCIFSVAVVGENGSQPVKFRVDGKLTTGLEIDVTKASRFNIDVEFGEKVDNLALEASLTEKVANL